MNNVNAGDNSSHSCLCGTYQETGPAKHCNTVKCLQRTTSPWGSSWYYTHYESKRDWKHHTAYPGTHTYYATEPRFLWTHFFVNQIDYILCSQRWRSSTQSAKTRPGADCGSDHELLIAKFRLKLKNVGKTTRPFMYDLNQIPYDYTVEVGNRFKGLDLIDSEPDEIWTEVHDTV